MEPLTAKGIATNGQEVATGAVQEITRQHSAITTHPQEADPLIGWFGLAAGVKESRLRKQKRGWQRGGK